MSETLSKTMVDEADPQSIAERQQDEPGSFLDIYRSLSLDHLPLDENFVDLCVHAGIVPVSMRYGAMRRGPIDVYRGVVKSFDGSWHYFNWSEGNAFTVDPADDATKQWEAERYYKSCSLGCDIRKAGSPVDPGEAVEEDTDGELEKQTSAVSSVDEAQWVAQQQTAITERHPGAAGSHTPDDPTVGRNWHAKALSRPGDAAPITPQGESTQHWDTAGLVKAWGKSLQQTAPRVSPNIDQLEARYLQEVMGVTQNDIQKGVRLPPRHRLSFEQWKTQQLKNKLNNLKNWTGK